MTRTATPAPPRFTVNTAHGRTELLNVEWPEVRRYFAERHIIHAELCLVLDVRDRLPLGAKGLSPYSHMIVRVA